MQFKIKNTDYKISFSFLALILFMLTISKNRTVILMFLFAFIHEIVHLVFIYHFSVAPKTVSFTLFGANIQREITSANNTNSEIIINASAPVFNIFTGAVFFLLSKYYSNNQILLINIAYINLALGCFNFLPFYSFDGGIVLKNYLFKYFTIEKTEQVLTFTSLIVAVMLSFLAIYIFLNYQHNFSLFIMCIYMFLSIIFKK